MSIPPLRFAPWDVKEQLSPTKYESLNAALSRVLFHAHTLPDSKFDIAWTRAFVCAYAQDTARHTVQALDEPESSKPILSAHELSIHALTLRLAGRLAKVRDGLNVSVLVDLAVAYGSGNTTSVQALFSEAFQSTPALLEEFKIEVLPVFMATLQSPDRRSTYVLSQLLHCGSQVALLFAEDKAFVVELARNYQIVLDKLAASRGGLDLDVTKPWPSWQKDWLYTKIGLLDSFQAVVQVLLRSLLPKHTDYLFDVLFMILDLPFSSAPLRVPFVSQPLLNDYQYAFDISSQLNEKFRSTDDARVDFLVATLVDMSPASQYPKAPGVLSILLKDRIRSRNVDLPASSDVKGKGKADPEKENDLLNLQREEMLDLLVSQVLEILPAEDPQHVLRCLKHPAFDGDTEKLIAALLEGVLPPELTHDDFAYISHKEEFEFTKDRRNIWDDDAMDFSKLRIGKSKEDAETLFQDRSFIEQMKADIIRRAEELSGKEDSAPQEQTVAFEEELDEAVVSFIAEAVKVVGDGEESDDKDGEGEGEDSGTTSPETILELAYIDDPKLFNRDAATRRSKSRSNLKAKTGWGNEQIEGWRIMLERNPNKGRVLAKHEFAGNSLLLPSMNAPEQGTNISSRDGPSHRGRGGDSRGRGGGSRGRGGNGGSNTTRDRAWKDKNKARQGNHNRKRGHDKKMARGGAPM